MTNALRGRTKTVAAVVAIAIIGARPARADDGAATSSIPAREALPRPPVEAGPRSGSIGGELGAGLGGVAVTSLVALVTAVAVARRGSRDPNCTDMCGIGQVLEGLAAGGLVLIGGTAFGVPTFVWLGGGGTAGPGTFGGALVGSVVGTAADVALTVAVAKTGFSSDAMGWAYVGAMVLLPVVSSVAGYELSVPNRASTSSLPSLAPFVAPLADHHGVAAGFSGRF